MNKAETKFLPEMSSALRSRESAAWLAVLLAGATVLLLAALHVLSPEFSPSWRVISEYAFGRYAWVLSLMFLCMGTSSWALAAAIRPEVSSTGGQVGLWLLLIAGLGGAMASFFDIRHEIGHAIAGFLGVIGFPIAALLLSAALGRNENWRAARTRLLWIATLSWISVVLLVATLAIMTMQMSRLKWGPFAATCAKSAATGCAGMGWMGRPIDRVVQLCVGARCRVASHSGAPQPVFQSVGGGCILD